MAALAVGAEACTPAIAGTFTGAELAGIRAFGVADGISTVEETPTDGEAGTSSGRAALPVVPANLASLPPTVTIGFAGASPARGSLGELAVVASTPGTGEGAAACATENWAGVSSPDLVSTPGIGLGTSAGPEDSS